jgi:hypothetical protein
VNLPAFTLQAIRTSPEASEGRWSECDAALKPGRCPGGGEQLSDVPVLQEAMRPRVKIVSLTVSSHRPGSSEAASS